LVEAGNATIGGRARPVDAAARGQGAAREEGREEVHGSPHAPLSGRHKAAQLRRAAFQTREAD